MKKFIFLLGAFAGYYAGYIRHDNPLPTVFLVIIVLFIFFDLWMSSEESFG